MAGPTPTPLRRLLRAAAWGTALGVAAGGAGLATSAAAATMQFLAPPTILPMSHSGLVAPAYGPTYRIATARPISISLRQEGGPQESESRIDESSAAWASFSPAASSVPSSASAWLAALASSGAVLLSLWRGQGSHLWLPPRLPRPSPRSSTPSAPGVPDFLAPGSPDWAVATVGVMEGPTNLKQAEQSAFHPILENRARTLLTVARMHRRQLRSFFVTMLLYTAVLLFTSAIGYRIYPYLHKAIRIIDPSMLALDLVEIGQPLGIVITTLAISFGNLLSTALGFGFQRLQAIRQSYYDEAAQLGVLTNDLLLLFHDRPNEREAAIRRLLRHGRAIYYTTDKARRDPRNGLDYVYIPGVTSPFDDPLVRIIRQVSTYSGNLRARDAFLERILDRIDASCRELTNKRDERLSWELSKPPTALYFSLISLNALFVLAYIMLTCKLTWEGYKLFFAAIIGACSLLYLVLVDLNSVHGGAFTIHAGLLSQSGTAPILTPTIESMAFFLKEARQECKMKGIQLKKDREF